MGSILGKFNCLGGLVMKPSKIVPRDRAAAPSPPPLIGIGFRARFRWNTERKIDGKTFKRFKMYGNDLSQARADAQILRDNENMHVRVLRFSNGYHLFTWKNRSSTSSRVRAPDPMPTSGDVDGVLTKFHRRYESTRYPCSRCSRMVLRDGRGKHCARCLREMGATTYRKTEMWNDPNAYKNPRNQLVRSFTSPLKTEEELRQMAKDEAAMKNGQRRVSAKWFYVAIGNEVYRRPKS